MKREKRYTWLEVSLWTGLILGAFVLFSGCDLSSSQDPQGQITTWVCENSYWTGYKGCRDYNSYSYQKAEDPAQFIYAAYRLLFGGPAVKAPSTTCPTIAFSTPLNQVTLGFDQTGKTIFTAPMYRQADGSFSANGYSLPVGSSNAVGTKVASLAQAQSYFYTCSGLTPANPAPHAATLGDLPGTMSRDSVVANLGGAAPYAEMKIVNGALNVVLDTQNTFGNSTTVYKTDPQNTPYYIVVADFNGDGKRDVVVNNYGSPGSVSIFLGNGNGTLQPANNYSVGQYPVSMTSFDFNKDGRADLAVVNKGDNTVNILLGNANGSMTKANTYPLPGNPFGTNYSMVAADFDGDGRGDVIVYNDTSFTLLHGNGDGSFQVMPQLAGYKPFYKPSFLAAGDFNKDGKMDLASLNTDGTVSVLINAGDGSFPTQNRYVAGTPYTTGDASAGMFATDFNDDGNLDLVIANGHPDMLLGNPENVTVLLGKGDGTFTGAPAYEVGFGPTAMVTADFNGDGIADLVVSTPNSLANKSGIWMLLGKSGGGLQTATEVPASGIGDANYVATADLNNDHKPDLVTVDRANVYTWLGKGDGTFQAPTSNTAGKNPTFVTTGDVNGDGVPDLLVGFGSANVSSAFPTGSPVLLTSKAGGGYNPAAPVTTGTNTVNAVLVDVNGDGKLDLVAANIGYPAGDVNFANPVPGNVTVSLGNGNGTFQAATAYTVGLYPSWVTVADVNLDGRPDLIVGVNTATSSQIGVLLGNGNGTFGSPSLFDVYTVVTGMIVADFNGDGKPDLAATHGASSAPVTVLQGNGDGTFKVQAYLPAGDTPVALAAANFSGSGKPDLAVLDQAYQGTGSVGMFRNISAASGCTYSLSANPSQFAATANTGSFTVTASCAWTAASNNSDWLTVTSGSSGSGNGTVGYSVAANTRAARTGTIIAGGQTFTVTQAAGSSGGGTPQAVSVSPGSTTAATQSYTFTFSDTAGYQNINVANVLVNNFIDGRAACYVAVVPSSASVAAVYLVDDAGDAGGPYQGMTLPGSGTVQNSQCSISGTGSSIAGSGTTLTVTLAITFKPAFGGNRVIYVAAREAAGANSGWQALGTAGVPGANVSGPSVGGVSPARSSGSGAVSYVFTFNDTNGFQDLGVVNVLINDALNGNQACYLAYSRSANVLYLVNDTGTALSNGTPLNGSSNVGNSQCTVTGAGSSLSTSGNTLTLTLNLSFSSSFAGNRLIYMAARSNGDVLNSGWQAVGSRTVQAANAGAFIRTLAYNEISQFTRSVQWGNPVISASGNRIVFGDGPGVETNGRYNDIFVVNADGTGMHEVDSYVQSCFCGATVDISGDGSTVISTDGILLRSASAAGGSGKTIVNNREIYYPRLSALGDRAFFLNRRGSASAGDPTTERGLYVVNVDGTGLRQIAGPTQVAALLGITADQVFPFATNGWSLDVSDDGNHVVFGVATPTGERLMGVNTDGTGLKQLLGPYSFVNHAAISGDGLKVAYDATPPPCCSTPNETGVINWDGSGKRALDTQVSVSGAERIYLNSDGSQLLYGDTSRLYATDGSGVVETSARGGYFSSDPAELVYDGLYLATMNRAASRFAYIVKDDAGRYQLATMDINPASLGQAPAISNVAINPGSIAQSGSAATISANVTTANQVTRVSNAELLNGLTDPNMSNSVMQVSSGAYSGQIQAFSAAAVGPRTVRVKAEVRDGSNLRHATAVEIGGLQVTSR